MIKTGAALRAELVAIARASAASGGPLPTRERLAELAGATLRQIDRQIEQLLAAGTIKTERRNRRTWVRAVKE